MATTNVDTTTESGTSKIRAFFTSNSLNFVENEWFFLSVSGVAVILWVISGAVALSAGTTVTELTQSLSGSSSDDDNSNYKNVGKASNEQTAGGALLGIGIVFLIFWIFCAVTFLMRKMK